ncbi:C2 domain-containing protein protein [Babesia ovis]|uniref:C2 domain-containing protein protein n=1 Tax=Babesia ovis TaxID=5869 RepID=A0A9W5WTM9_BABOV|nr:C2 domain-containing protein protein [Babesia ovis]
MQLLKVAGLNFDLFSKGSAKNDAAERHAAELDKNGDADTSTFDGTVSLGRDPGLKPTDASQQNDGITDVNDELADHELLWSTEYTYDEFIDSLSVAHEGRGDTHTEKQHWSYPRRWVVKLHNLKIVNCVSDSLTCFAEFDFGGSRSECRVQMGGSVCILNRGETKNYIRTTVVQNVTKDVPRSFNCTHEFEYRGSYLDLENEKLKIKLWKYRRYTVNCLESIYEGQLLQFATGDIHVEIPMYKGVNKQRHLRCRISFDLYFQELYDFELSFLSWRLLDIPSFIELINKGKEATKSLQTDTKGGKGKPENRRRSNMSFSIFDKMTYFFIRKRIERDFKKNAELKMEQNNLLEDDKQISMNTLDPYKLLLECQSDIVFKGNTITRFDSALPSIRLQIHVKTDSAYRHATSLQLTSIISKNARDAYWENMGEIIFRGTLMDLERSELEIDIVDTDAPKAASKVGRVVLPLSGIVDYPYLDSKINKPKWLSLKASMEGWGSTLERLNFGRLTGSIQIQNKPRYRQKTTPSGLTLYSYPIMLIVTIGGIDQLITDDDDANIDSYVEVTFNRQTYRTYICKNNRAPTWNEDILIPFLMSDADKISCSVILQSSPIRFSIWGTSSRDGKVMYLGGTVLYPYEIFYTAKGALKQRVKKTYAENGQYGNIYHSRVFETRVFNGPLKLSFLTEDHQSNLTVSAWLYPDIPDEVMPEQFDSRLVRSVHPQLLSYLMTPYYSRLLEDWRKVVEMKLKPVFKDSAAITVECRTQYHQRVYYPCLITPMHPPMGIDTPNAIFHMIRCLPFVRKTYDIRFTPDFLMKLKGGNAFDHCLLQVSYLRGLIPPVEAFVCVGTTHQGRYHAWVTTFAPVEKNSVKMWESTTGECNVLKNRLQSEDDKNDSINDRRLRLKSSNKFPYKTLLYMFNENNVWLNIQGHTDPQLLLFDMDNKDLWYPFTPPLTHIDRVHVPKISYTKVNDYEMQRLSNELQQNVERHLTIHRYAQNLQTRWNKDEALNDFLITGMKLLHQINTCPDADIQLAKCELQEWRLLLNKNIPQSHQVVVIPVHFNTLDAEFIADNIKNNVPLLDSRERFITFAMSSRVISLPGNLFSVYVILLIAQKIHERVRIRLVMEQERLAQKKRKKKLSSVADEDSNEVVNREDNLNESLKAALESNIEMSGEDAVPKKQFSALVNQIDQNIKSKDSQLDTLLSRTFTKVISPSSKDKFDDGDTKRSSDVDSNFSSDFNRGSSDLEGSSKVSSESTMTINFSNLSSSARSSSRIDIPVDEIQSPEDSDSNMYIANAPSYDFDRRDTSGSAVIGGTYISSYRDDVANPHLLSRDSFAMSALSSTIGSRLLIQTGSFEFSDPDKQEPESPIETMQTKARRGNVKARQQSMADESPSLLPLDTASLPPSALNSFAYSHEDSGYGGVDSITSALQSMSPSSESDGILDTTDSDGDKLRYATSEDYNSNLESDYSRSSTLKSYIALSRHSSSTLADRAIVEDDVLDSNLVSDYGSPNLTDSDGVDLKKSSDSDISYTENDDWSDSMPISAKTSIATTNKDLYSDSYVSSALESEAEDIQSAATPPINRNLLSQAQFDTDTPRSTSLHSGRTHASSKSVSDRSSVRSSSVLNDNVGQRTPSIKHTGQRTVPKEESPNITGQRTPSQPSLTKSVKRTSIGKYPTDEKSKQPQSADAPPPYISRGSFLGLEPEYSMCSTENEGYSSISSDSTSVGRVSFAKTATLYTTDNITTQVPTHEGDTPSQRLARSLFDKSRVKKGEQKRDSDQSYSVCDFKYVDLFRGFL